MGHDSGIDFLLLVLIITLVQSNSCWDNFFSVTIFIASFLYKYNVWKTLDYASKEHGCPYLMHCHKSFPEIVLSMNFNAGNFDVAILLIVQY